MRHTAASQLLCILALCAGGCGDLPRSVGPVEPDGTPPAQFAQVPAGYEVVDLGTFGAQLAGAFVVTDAGVVYGRYGSPGAIRSFRWSARDGMTDLGDLDGRPFFVQGANNRGDMVGSIRMPQAPFGNVTRPVAWLKGEGFVYLDDEEHGGQAWDINERGEIVGVRQRLGTATNAPFIWSRKVGMREIPTPAPGGQAQAINNRGQVVGTVPVPGDCCNHAFVWSDKDGMTLIPNLGGWGFALDINDRGEVVGESGLGGDDPGAHRGGPGFPAQLPAHAFYWSQRTGTVDLGTLGGDQSVAWAIDQHGAVYGWSVTDTVQRRHVAMRWTPATGMVAIPALGGNYSEIFDVNHGGVAAGEAAPPMSPGHAVLFVPR